MPVALPLDVAELTRRMRSGEEAAYREFYDAYYSRLLRYLLVVAAGDEEAAAEALEGALLRVVRYIKLFATEEAFWSWLTVWPAALTAITRANAAGTWRFWTGSQCTRACNSPALQAPRPSTGCNRHWMRLWPLCPPTNGNCWSGIFRPSVGAGYCR